MGAPSYPVATQARPPVRSARGRLVVYPPSHQASTYAASLTIPSSSTSSETPLHIVSSFVHLVTQWMSTVTASWGSSPSSSHVQERGSPTAPPIVKLQSSSRVLGVGPAESTG